MRFNRAQASSGGVTVRRAVPKTGPTADGSAVKRMPYGLSPLIELYGTKKFVVEWLDRSANCIVRTVRVAQLMHGSFIDCAKADVSSVSAGIYRTRALGRRVVFRVELLVRLGEAAFARRFLEV